MNFRNWLEQTTFPLRIQLAPKEKEWVDWAVHALYDIAGTEDFEFEENDIPTLGATWVTFHHYSQGIFDELMYRLEDMAPDVAKTDASSDREVVSRYRPALSAAKKIMYHP